MIGHNHNRVQPVSVYLYIFIFEIFFIIQADSQLEKSMQIGNVDFDFKNVKKNISKWTNTLKLEIVKEFKKLEND